MAVVKIEALRWLRERIMCAIPELDGKVCVGQAPPNHGLGFPSLAIIPVGKWRFYPDQEGDDVFQPGPGRSIVRLGRHEVMVQLQLACNTPDERYELAQRVEMNVFQATEGHPGIVYGNVVPLAEDFGKVEASAELDDEEWHDGKAFGGQSWSYITARVFCPALGTRHGVYSMKEIQLGLTDVFTSDVTATSFSTDPTIERVTVAEDGTISPT